MKNINLVIMTLLKEWVIKMEEQTIIELLKEINEIIEIINGGK